MVDRTIHSMARVGVFSSRFAFTARSILFPFCGIRMILKVFLKAVVSESFNQHNQSLADSAVITHTMLSASTSTRITLRADGFIWGVWTYLHLCLGKHLSELWQQTVNSTRKPGFRILARFSCSLESLFKYLRDLSCGTHMFLLIDCTLIKITS